MTRILVACLIAVAAWPAAASAGGFQIGFFDGQVGGQGEAARRLDDAVQAGARVMRVPISWPGVAPVRPLRPRDPGDPVYRWGPVDAMVNAVRARGLAVLVSIDQAATWAQAPDRPEDARDGAW